jgi:hypothetical protein
MLGRDSKVSIESNSEKIERRRLHVTDRDGRRAAEQHAERIRWRKPWRPTEALVGDEGLVSFLVDRNGFL